MARLTASKVRRRLFELLDQVEAGAPSVVLERRGVRFRIVLEERPEHLPRSRPSSPPPLVIVDERIEDGEWTWVAADSGHLHVEFPAEDRHIDPP